ncbi:MAG: hypothetical protein AB7P34_05440 [Vicinamibacterales bacterium]
MFTKTISLCVLLAATPAWAGQAAQPSQSAERAAQQLQAIKDRLALTPEQVELVRPVLVDEVQKLQALRDKYQGDRQNRRARLKAARELRDIQDAADERLKKILTKPQMDEMKKIREERRQQLRQRPRA